MIGTNLGPTLITVQPTTRFKGQVNKTTELPVNSNAVTVNPSQANGLAIPISPPVTAGHIHVVIRHEEPNHHSNCADSRAAKCLAFTIPAAIAGAGVAYGLYPAMMNIPISIPKAAIIGTLGACTQSTQGGLMNMDNYNQFTLAITYGLGVGGAVAGAASTGLPLMPVPVFASIATCLIGSGARVATGTNN